MGDYCITGDETGLLKLIDPSANVCNVSGVQDRAKGILNLCHLSSSQQNSNEESWLFALSRRNGVLESWRCHQESLELLASTQLPAQDPVTSQIGYQLVSYGNNSVLCANNQGAVSVHRLTEAKSSSTSASWKTESTFQVRGPLSACSISTKGAESIAAFGGRENDLTLYDMQTQQECWAAKNVPLDSLRLRVPVWIASIAFINSDKSRGQERTNETNLIVTGTAYNHIRLYDTKASVRPVLSVTIDREAEDSGDKCQGRIMNVQPLPLASNPWNVMVSFSSGGLELWDLRTTRRLKTLRGAAGSTRCVDLQATCSNSSGRYRLATVGLDRYLRIYDVRASRSADQRPSKIRGPSKGSSFDSEYEPLKGTEIEFSIRSDSTVYLKNRLNCCLFLSSQKDSKSLGKRGADSDDEDDDSDRDDDDDDEDEDNDDDEDDEDDEDDDNSDELDEMEEMSDSEEEEEDEDDDEEDEEVVASKTNKKARMKR